MNASSGPSRIHRLDVSVTVLLWWVDRDVIYDGDGDRSEHRKSYGGHRRVSTVVVDETDDVLEALKGYQDCDR